MNDDWRLRIDLQDDGIARALSQRLAAEELEHGLERSFHDRVVVSVDGGEVFCYTGTRGQAEAAEALIRRLAEQKKWQLDVELTRWHPTAERWEDPDAPLPTDSAEVAQELQERVVIEREGSAEQGYPDFEVRVQCASRHEAGELAHRLDDEGIPNLHRWSYVLIGAADDAAAQALAERVRAEAPAGATIAVERNRRAIYDSLLTSPFAVLGGMGG